ncbi:MAG: OB-fold domain-containing protein [Acidimicrobiales bacterium]|nr:OB-fold domain-containing protein [Acidimicrobiales bacterium]
MSEIIIPEILQGKEPVQSVRTPIRMEYTFTPGVAAQAYLREFGKKKILGNVSPVDGAILVPPRGADPRHGVLCEEFVELPHQGHVGSFCITNVPIPGRKDLDLPYISAWIFLDGADIGFLNLVSECPPEDCRIGMRVEAVWKPDDEIGMTAENILYWRPNGEPDIPFDQAGVRGWRYRASENSDA